MKTRNVVSLLVSHCDVELYQVDDNVKIGTFLSFGSSSAAEWFDTRECTRLMDEHVSGRFNHAHVLWTLVVLQRWRERSSNSGALAEGAA